MDSSPDPSAIVAEGLSPAPVSPDVPLPRVFSSILHMCLVPAVACYFYKMSSARPLQGHGQALP